MRRASLILVFALLTTSAAGAEAPSKAPQGKPVPPAAVPAPPAPPENYNPPGVPDLPSGEQQEPEVTITTKGTEIHEEYRMNGRLYMVKVIPKKGKPYYLIDQEGSGQFRRSDLEPRIAVPTWVIKRF